MYRLWTCLLVCRCKLDSVTLNLPGRCFSASARLPPYTLSTLVTLSVPDFPLAVVSVVYRQIFLCLEATARSGIWGGASTLIPMQLGGLRSTVGGLTCECIFNQTPARKKVLSTARRYFPSRRKWPRGTMSVEGALKI